jgi:hypothetical protein
VKRSRAPKPSKTAVPPAHQAQGSQRIRAALWWEAPEEEALRAWVGDDDPVEPGGDLVNNREEQFAPSFVIPIKRERYLTLLGSTKGRRKITRDLNHCHDLDMAFCKLVPAGQQHLEAIRTILKRSLGAHAPCVLPSPTARGVGAPPNVFH